MSQMSPVLTAKQRREKIRDNIATHTYPEIAKLCGVHRRTICRDIAEWKREGGFDSFLLEQFFKLYGLLKVKEPKHAFDRICDLLRRREQQVTTMRLEGGEKPLIVKMYKPDIDGAE